MRNLTLALVAESCASGLILAPCQHVLVLIRTLALLRLAATVIPAELVTNSLEPDLIHLNVLDLLEVVESELSLVQ
jgi:hypothetical protein